MNENERKWTKMNQYSGNPVNENEWKWIKMNQLTKMNEVNENEPNESR